MCDAQAHNILEEAIFFSLGFKFDRLCLRSCVILNNPISVIVEPGATNSSAEDAIRASLEGSHD
jgi:hypothetical protein